MADSVDWILEDFGDALERLREALDKPVEQDLLKAGCIQYFEFCFELAWKSIKMVSALVGLPECLSPKACLRQAFSQGWLADEEIGLEMLNARNRMSHTYDARKALEIYERLPTFHAEMVSLLEQLCMAAKR